MWQLLTHPVFGRLFAAQCVALLGTGLMTVALGLLAFELADGQAGLVLGTALTIKMVAYVAVTPLANAATSRFSRKTVLISADLVRAAAALCLPFVSEVWHIFLLIFALQSASATFTPAFQATIPEVLPKSHDYTRALSLSRLAYDLETLLSPLIAAALLSIVGFSDLFIGTGAGFILSGLLVNSVVLPSKAVEASSGFWDRVTRGSALYLATPRLRGLLALTLSGALGGSIVFVNTVVMVRVEMARSESDLALALVAFGLGSMAVALALPRLLEKAPDRSVMSAAAIIQGIILGTVALWIAIFELPSWPVFLVIWAMLGANYAAIVTPTGRVIQRSTHAEDRAALFAAHFALSHACWLVAYPLAGWLGAYVGMAAAMGVAGVFGVSCALVAQRLWPKNSAAPLVHEHPELSPDHPHLAKHTGPDGRHKHPVVIDVLHRTWPG